MRTLRILTATAITIAFAVGVWWLFSYSPSEYRGAAPMRDTGVFSYPRYHATLGEIPLADAGDNTLKFSGLPSERMTLQLYVVGGSDADGDLLRSLTTELSAYIVDSQGQVICSAIGTPSKSDSTARWALMSSGVDAAYWHDHCRMSLSRGIQTTRFICQLAMLIHARPMCYLGQPSKVVGLSYPRFKFEVRQSPNTSFQRTQVRALRGLGPLNSDR